MAQKSGVIAENEPKTIEKIRKYVRITENGPKNGHNWQARPKSAKKSLMAVSYQSTPKLPHLNETKRNGPNVVPNGQQ